MCVCVCVTITALEGGPWTQLALHTDWADWASSENELNYWERQNTDRRGKYNNLPTNKTNPADVADERSAA